jgi:formylglycine-generating enzyme required for sulfatase activity
MSGNVWEWCLTKWRDPYEHVLALDEEISSDRRRMAKGGSWNHLEGGARAEFRNNHWPHNRNDVLGFRICAPGL